MARRTRDGVLISVCPDCGNDLTGAVQAMLHYDRVNGPTPCELHQKLREGGRHAATV